MSKRSIFKDSSISSALSSKSFSTQQHTSTKEQQDQYITINNNNENNNNTTWSFITRRITNNKKRNKFLLRLSRILLRYPPPLVLLCVTLFICFFYYQLFNLPSFASFTINSSSSSTLTSTKQEKMKVITHGTCIKTASLKAGDEDYMAYNVPILHFSKNTSFRFEPNKDFDNLYMTLWRSKMYYMKYSLRKEMKERLVQGTHFDYFVQFIKGRSKRPVNPVAERTEVVQPFTESSDIFTFLKTPKEEVLFAMRVLNDKSQKEVCQHGSHPLFTSMDAKELEKYVILECRGGGGGGGKNNKNINNNNKNMNKGGNHMNENENENENEQENEQEKGKERDWKDEFASLIVNSHPFSPGCVVLVIQPSLKLPQVYIYILK